MKEMYVKFTKKNMFKMDAQTFWSVFLVALLYKLFYYSYSIKNHNTEFEIDRTIPIC